ncbi:mannose-1-phosphate guanylyltransferase, partial [Microbacterium sp. 9H2]
DASTGLVVSQTERIIAVVGVNDLIVVDTPDALLVTTSAHAQRVKSLVGTLQENGHDGVL